MAYLLTVLEMSQITVLKEMGNKRADLSNSRK